MPPTLKYIQRVKRRGRSWYYFRRGGFRMPLPGDPSAPEFHTRYGELLALSQTGRFETERAPPGSLHALIRDYKCAPEYSGLAAKTQREYAKMLDFLQPIAHFPASEIKRANIIQIRNFIARDGRKRTADIFVAVVSALYRVGLDLGYDIETNPCTKIKKIAKGTAHKPWPLDAQKIFEASNPPPHIMSAYMIGLWTALRLGNVMALSRGNFDGTGFDITHFKTEQKSWIPAVVPLRSYIDTLPRDRLLYVTDENGRPIPIRRFSADFRKWLNKIGLNDLVFHGLRATTATALAEAGASDQEIASITGHRSAQMVRHYSKSASQKLLAIRAMNRIDRKKL